MLHALALGADWVWLADDDGRPQDAEVLATLLACAQKHRLAEVSPMVCDLDHPAAAGVSAAPRPGVAPARRGAAHRRRRTRICCPGIASLFNGALFRAATLEAVGVPDLRLFVRGDEVEIHRRLVRVRAAVRDLPGRRCTCTRTAPTSSSRSSAAECTPSTPTTRPSGTSPTATAATCCRSPVCASCCRRSGCGSAGIS